MEEARLIERRFRRVGLPPAEAIEPARLVLVLLHAETVLDHHGEIGDRLGEALRGGLRYQSTAAA
jgi:hypothetical protein